jgi:hypothetical protein
VREVAQLDDVVSAQRFELSQVQMHSWRYRYAAIYEIEHGREAAALQSMLATFPNESDVADFAHAHSMVLSSISELITWDRARLRVAQKVSFDQPPRMSMPAVHPNAQIAESSPTSIPPVWLECPKYRAFAPQWLTCALSRRFPGCVVRSAETDSVTIGTTSHYRVHLTYSEGEGPASVFIKAQGRLGKRVLLSTMGLLTPETKMLGSSERVPLETPEIFAAAINRTRLDSLLVMEDLALRGAEMNHVTKPFPLNRIYRGLDQLARLHGRYWNGLPSTLHGVEPWKMRLGWKTLALLAGLQGLPRMQRYGVLDQIPPELHRWNSCLWLTRRAIELSSEGPQTLVHGDTHVGNTYNLPNGDLGFVDWQCVHKGSWSRDVAYFMICGMEVADRRKHEREMLRYYFDALAQAGGQPLSWDEMWRSYRSAPAYGLVAWISTLAGDDYQPTEVNLRYIERFGAAYKDLETTRLLRGEG